jgi:hypothetical protein
MKTLDSIATHAALRFDELTAQRDAALELLRQLLAMRKGNEFGRPAEQAVWRSVKALLVEVGR